MMVQTVVAWAIHQPRHRSERNRASNGNAAGRAETHPHAAVGAPNSARVGSTLSFELVSVFQDVNRTPSKR